MNKFVLIPYDQYASFKNYLLKKNHDLSSDKEEKKVIADNEEVENKSEKETLNKNDSSADIIDEKREKYQMTLIIINH